jgi:uncharacterized protein YbjQ (UPF0145 family)
VCGAYVGHNIVHMYEVCVGQAVCGAYVGHNTVNMYEVCVGQAECVVHTLT